MMGIESHHRIGLYNGFGKDQGDDAEAEFDDLTEPTNFTLTWEYIDDGSNAMWGIKWENIDYGSAAKALPEIIPNTVSTFKIQGWFYTAAWSWNKAGKFFWISNRSGHGGTRTSNFDDINFGFNVGTYLQVGITEAGVSRLNSTVDISSYGFAANTWLKWEIDVDVSNGTIDFYMD